MKNVLCLIAFLSLLGMRTLLAAEGKIRPPGPPISEIVIPAVQQADDERVAATIGADRSRLDAIFSEELHYAHSSGAVDTKTSYMEALLSGRTKYRSIEYEKREFKVLSPAIVSMTGRAHFKSENNGQPVQLYLSFLALWRREGEVWRFVSWQSCRLAPPAIPAAAKP